MMAGSGPRRASRDDRNTDTQDPRTPITITSTGCNNREAGIVRYTGLVQTWSIFADFGHRQIFHVGIREKVAAVEVIV
jgi:hypothetical protein